MKTPAKVPRGRPKQVWYDSMAQWAAVAGRPVSDAKRAKLDPFAGKRFFRHTRVSSWLVYWLDDNPVAVGARLVVSEKERLQAEKLIKENRALDFEHDLQVKKYASIEETKSIWAAHCEIFRKAVLTFVDKSAYNNIVREIKKQIKEIDL